MWQEAASPSCYCSRRRKYSSAECSGQAHLPSVRTYVTGRRMSPLRSAPFRGWSGPRPPIFRPSIRFLWPARAREPPCRFSRFLHTYPCAQHRDRQTHRPRYGKSSVNDSVIKCRPTPEWAKTIRWCCVQPVENCSPHVSHQSYTLTIAHRCSS